MVSRVSKETFRYWKYKDLEYVSTSIQVLLMDQVWTARIVW